MSKESFNFAYQIINQIIAIGKITSQKTMNISKNPKDKIMFLKIFSIITSLIYTKLHIENNITKKGMDYFVPRNDE